MDFSPPSEDVAKGLELEHRHRRPERGFITVDGGIRLPVIIGNPSGSCTMPSGSRVSPVWEQLVTAVFSKGKAPTDEASAEDVLLWPPRPQWTQWCERWPGLAGPVGKLITRKVGMLSEISSPSGEAPAHVAAGCVWRRLDIGENSYDLAIAAPGSAAWRIFKDGVEKPRAESWRVVSEMAQACTPAAATTGGMPVTMAGLIERWPGVALMVVQEVAVLAGAAADVQLGGW